MTRAEILHELRYFVAHCTNMDGSIPDEVFVLVRRSVIEAAQAVVAGMEAREAEAGRAA